MEITAALLADLTLLTGALDDEGPDVIESLRRLSDDARSAVDSYLGLTVVVHDSEPALTFTSLADPGEPVAAGASILIPLDEGAEPSVVLILYAATPGAFVDLAADLSWLTGREHRDFVLDDHLVVQSPPDEDSTLRAASLINQALGVLIGRGRTPETAHRDLDELAAEAGIGRRAAAELILRGVRGDVIDPDPGLDIA